MEGTGTLCIKLRFLLPFARVLQGKATVSLGSNWPELVVSAWKSLCPAMANLLAGWGFLQWFETFLQESQEHHFRL